MPLPDDQLHANLQRLSEKLDADAAGDPRCQSRRAAPDPTARRMAERMPLAHSLGEAALLAVVREGRIVSQRALVARGVTAQRPESSEVQLGTDGHVFTFVAPFRYPATMAGFLFGPPIESELRERASAAPFDSGGLIEHFERPDSGEPVRAFLGRHELPVPDYRGLLGSVLALSFAQPWHYVEGGPLDGPHPAGLRASAAGTDARLFTFEVRFVEELGLNQPLLAVFLPVALASEPDVLRAARGWRERGVAFRPYPSPWSRGAAATTAWPFLLAEGVAFVKAHLERRDD